MMAFGMPGPLELGIILLILLLLVGVKKLPELGSSIGKSFKELKKGLKENTDDSEEHKDSTKF